MDAFSREIYARVSSISLEPILKIPEMLKTFDLGKYPANEELVSGSIKDILSPTSTFNFLASNLPKTILLLV